MTRCCVIAEIGVNHNGSMDMARRLIDVALDAGCDAAKFQVFRAEQLVTKGASKASYQARTTGEDETQFQMLKSLELATDDIRSLKRYCDERGIEFLATPFDEQSASLLVGLGVRRIKVSSGDLTNVPLLDHLRRLGLPVILSTGMATLDEVRVAVTALSAVDLTLLHCVTSYPAPEGASNLSAMETMRRYFGLPVGWSDHTLGTTIALAAAALGASVIEKHITLGRDLPGPDHAASLEPAELAEMVRGVRLIDGAIGDGIKRPQACEIENIPAARRSIVALRPIDAGETLSVLNLGMRRPGTGLGGEHFPVVLGRRTARAIPEGTLIDFDMLLGDV